MGGNSRARMVDPSQHLSVWHNRLRTVMMSRACAALSRQVPDRILCCANVARMNHVRFGYADDKMEVLPNGFDVSRFKPAPDAISTSE
jgi:hypothetical protein